jgi:uncharacterized membrane protein
MSLVGIGVSIYLTVVHYDSKLTLACTKGGFVNCTDVTTSAWSVVPGTQWPITIPGMIWFVVAGVLAVWSLTALARGHEEPQYARLALMVWSAPALLFVLYLIQVEIVDVRKLCEWCTSVHIMTVAIFVIALNRWLRRNDPLEEPIAQPVFATPPIRRAPPQGLSRRAQAAIRQRATTTRR